MPQPDSTQVLQVNKPLTNVSVAYTQQGTWLADRVFPKVPVDRQGDLYWKYNRGDWFRGMAELRAPATESSGGGYRLETSPYFANVYAVHRDIDSQTRANFKSTFNLDSDATRWVTQQLLIKRDRLWLSEYFTTGVWTGKAVSGAGVVGTVDDDVDWTNAGSGDPILEVRNTSDEMEAKTGYRPNTLVLGRKLMTTLSQHPDVLARIQYTQSHLAGVDDSAVAQAFGVKRIVVSNTIQNSGDYLGTESMDFQAGDGALLCYAAPSAGLLQPSAGYTFSWNGYLGGTSDGANITRFPDAKTKSDRIEGEMAFDFGVVASELGVFFATPNAA